jgi:hypothetical protein
MKSSFVFAKLWLWLTKYQILKSTGLWVLIALAAASGGCSAQRPQVPVKFELTELDFYNELATWSENSRRYPYPITENFKQRYADVYALGEKGFLPARVVVKVLPAPVTFKYDEAALSELLTAAKNGDDGAGCTLWSIMLPNPKEYAWLDFEKVLAPLVLRGAANGHGYCLNIAGIQYLIGQAGIERDMSKARSLLVRAAAQGHFTAQVQLATSPVWPWSDGDLNNVKRVEANLCWLAVADRHASGAFQSLASQIRRQLDEGHRYGFIDPENRPVLEQLLDKWATPPRVIVPKLQLTNPQCLELEEKASR